MTIGSRPGDMRSHSIVAIPASNEERQIEACLAALAAQRDGCGAPVEAGRFTILVYANNCTDRTADTVRAFATTCPHQVVVVEEKLEPVHSNAGWARKRAMDIAAERLRDSHHHAGLLMTTDADSCVASTWFSETVAAIQGGVDCVAGYIDAFPSEIMRLGRGFVERSRLEDRYLRLMAEIHARCDPRLHDPWPNHRVSSGASLAVTLAAYHAVGGMPPQALGEDAAFTKVLEAAGFLVRHPMSVLVGTSCRFDGRAKGGAGDTMRLRHDELDAPCDDDVEPVRLVLRRALWRGTLRRDVAARDAGTARWATRLGLTSAEWATLLDRMAGLPFEALWFELVGLSPVLCRYATLRPRNLPGEIEKAERLVERLRASASVPLRITGRRDDTRPRAIA